MLSLGTSSTTTSTTQLRQVLPLKVIYRTTNLSPTTKIAGT